MALLLSLAAVHPGLQQVVLAVGLFLHASTHFRAPVQHTCLSCDQTTHVWPAHTGDGPGCRRHAPRRVAAARRPGKHISVYATLLPTDAWQLMNSCFQPFGCAGWVFSAACGSNHHVRLPL